MDTKSKKFNKSIISKTIAFLLAIIMFAVSVVKVTLFLSDYFNHDDNNYRYYVNSYAEEILTGKDNSRFEESDVFLTKFAEIVTTALQGYNTFGDGSKKAYEEYQSAKKSLAKMSKLEYVKKQLEALLGESGHGSPAALIYFMSEVDNDLLQLVASHDDHYIENPLCFDGDNFYTAVTKYDTDEYYDEHGMYVTTMMPYDEDVYCNISLHSSNGILSANFDKKYQSKRDIPASVIQKAGKDAYVVELCHCEYFDDIYDGYYKIDLNVLRDYFDDNLETFASYNGYNSTDYRATFGYSFENYEQFKSENKNFLKQMSAMKNLKIAVVDNKTGIAKSNVASLDGKTFGKKDLDLFREYDLFYKINLKTGEDKLYSGPVMSDETDDYKSSLKNHYSSNAINISCFTLNDLYINHNDNTVYVAFDSALTENDEFNVISSTYAQVKKQTDKMLLSVGICLAVMLVCIIYLVIRSGRRSGDDELHMMRADKMFLLLRIALNAALVVGCGFLGFLMICLVFDKHIQSALFNLAIGACAALAMTFVIDLILYIARNIKNHTLFKNFFIVRLIIKIYNPLKTKRAEKPIIYRDIMNDVVRRIVIWVVLPNLIAGCAMLLYLYGFDAWPLAFLTGLLLIGYDIFVVVYACRYAYYIREIVRSVGRIRNGEDIKINIHKMPVALQGFANDINCLNDGLRIAVDKAVKDERMKTELITNVSHDLKTPLTAIINYTDLLSRCDITDETARGYIDILGEKSARLKKLIEDLVEASKASSGAMKVELTSVSLNELSVQLIGEYNDDFERNRLDLIFTEEKENIIVKADGKLAYRVFDNLMSNIKKYAMPNTRVYLDLSVKNDQGVITLKNISGSRLNIPAEELLERFVRADSSRSSEGSGLGLSIAKNLCCLQGGSLNLSISGDLFTAEISYPLVNSN